MLFCRRVQVPSVLVARTQPSRPQRRGRAHPGEHEPIIDEALWEILHGTQPRQLTAKHLMSQTGFAKAWPSQTTQLGIT
jgi:hypothetical protein